jgi:hypothetical protein
VDTRASPWHDADINQAKEAAMSEQVKIGTLVAVDDGSLHRVIHITPSGRIRIEGRGNEEYRPVANQDGRWRHAGPVYGRFGMRDSSYARLATPDEIERHKQEKRAAILRDRIATALRTAEPGMVFQVADMLGVK